MDKETEDILRSLIHYKSESDGENLRQELYDRIKSGKADISVLVMPFNNSLYWYQTALVLERFCFDDVRFIVKDLFRWLEDINFPGAREVMYFLASFDKGKLIKDLEEVMEDILEKNDDCWAYGVVCYLSRAGCNREDFRTPELYDKIMKLADCD